MENNFEAAVKHVLRWEGGLVQDPLDPGALTNFGISGRSYPDLDIKKLKKSQAKEIYRRDYWEVCKCGELPPGLDLLVFDCAVNQGPKFAGRALQQSAETTVDGIIGPATLAAVSEANLPDIILEYTARRGVRYGRLSTFGRYGLGWMRRLADMHQQALQMTRVREN